MKPIEFLFYIINYFITLEPGRLSQLKDQASAWEKEQLDSEDSKLKKPLEYGSKWYTQVFLAILMIFTVKTISNWLVETPQLEIDDETTSDNIFNNKTKKFTLNN